MISKADLTRLKMEAVIDLVWLEERCKEDQDTGCWVWQHFISKEGVPRCSLQLAPGVRASFAVRRLVAKMKADMLPEQFERHNRNKQAGVRLSCTRGCCHPDHVVMQTRVQASDVMRGVPLTVLHKLRISQSRTRASKVSDEDVIQMLTCNESSVAIGRKLGVNKGYAAQVRKGKLRACGALGGGLFSGLLTPANGALYVSAETA